MNKIDEILYAQPLNDNKSGALKGIKVLITAGPTRERIDAVRYLTNFSSGKMGYAIAKCCQQQGANVTLISGPTSLKPPVGVDLVKVESADEMLNAVMSEAKGSQLIIKAAAVSDYRAATPQKQKIKKKDAITLQLEKTTDILQELGKIKTDTARQKLESKNLDLIVANNILQKDAGFDVDTNRVILIDKNGSNQLPLLSKDQVAERIVETILSTKRWKQIGNTIR